MVIQTSATVSISGGPVFSAGDELRARRHEARRVRAALLTRRTDADPPSPRLALTATVVGAGVAALTLLVLYLLGLAGL
jgi:multisubunit Na+/H+ antiporter MnhC subunit